MDTLWRVIQHTILVLGLFAPSMSYATPDLCTPLTQRQIAKNNSLSDDAAHLAPYAIMSNNAYERGDSPIPLPDGWKEVTELRKRLPNVGLALAVFERYESDKLVEIVVAFRGTDEKKDWVQNLVPFFRNQINPASEEFEKILKLYEEQNIAIVTTGHSLGGGLAFHMSFTYPNVDAIAFNSSPVTKAGTKIKKGNRRTSVWESGEILQAPRNPVNWIRIRWRDIRRLEFRFLHGLPVNQHGIELFASNLTKLGATKSNQLKGLISSQCTK